MIVPPSEPLLTTTSAVRNAEPRGGQDRLHGIIGRLVAARRGERNRLLFWASVRIGELVAEGELDAVAAGQALADAAAQVGLVREDGQRAVAASPARGGSYWLAR